ncbi:MAG: hypothetical protein AAF678_08665 [Pseudomonadota bacterium]
MRAVFIPIGLAVSLAACATNTPQTTINVDGRDYVASFVENRDPVTGDLIEIRYTVTEFGIECGSRAECEPLIREAEAARAAAALQPLAEEVSDADVGEPISAVDVQVTPLEAAAEAPPE